MSKVMVLRNKALQEFIEARRGLPFIWGKNDCCLFAADAILLQTNIDTASSYRGKYSTSLGAKRAIKKRKANNLDELLMIELGNDIAPLTAINGDIALILNQDNELAAGVIYRSYIYVLSPRGLSQIPLKAAIKCWSVKAISTKENS